MPEVNKVIGLGSACVDGKIISSNLHLPSEGRSLSLFLDRHQEAVLYPGGSISNILTAFVRLSNNPNVRLLSCVGDDPRGRFYTEHMDRRLGLPRISEKKSTDVWVGIYNHGLVEDMSYLDASTEFRVSNQELDLSRDAVFITDIQTCRTVTVLNSIEGILDAIGHQGIFVLSLVGSNPTENITSFLPFNNRPPDIVFGNEFELSCLTKKPDAVEAIADIFTDAMLIVITQAERGALVRFKGDVLRVPAKFVPTGLLVDEAGAGDSYMGTMLAILSSEKFTSLGKHDVISAATTASYAGALMIQSMHSQLSIGMAKQVANYAKQTISTKGMS